MATEGATPARASWSSKWAFILAAAASAIGLGNLWRFPYLAAKYGGGAFLLVYIILVVTFGFALMMAETALGRKTGQSAIGAFRSFGRKYIFIGVLASAVPFIITPYYALIGGWVTKFMAAYIFEGAEAIAADGYFVGFILNNGETFIWMYVFLAVVIGVCALGVKNGIERVNKVLMVALLAIAVGITIFSFTLPGALDGIAYYLIPDFSKFSVELVVAAMGQMFFSLSLAMGIMITYGSYFRRDDDLESSVRRIELFDTAIAILAGLMIIPAAVAVQGSAEAVANNAGPGFMFGILPQVFQGMGWAANIVGFVFFALVFFAALTSCISLFETLVSIVADGAHVSRGFSIAICAVFVTLMGTLVNLGYNQLLDVDLMYAIFHIGEPGNNQILDFFDFISNTVLMPVVALLTCIFVGWIVKPKMVIDEVQSSGEFKAQGLFVVMIKYIAPVFVVCILVAYIMNTIGIIAL